MSNSNIDEIKNNNNEKEHDEIKANNNSETESKTDHPVQNNVSSEKLRESESKIDEKNKKETYIKVENILAPSTNKKHIVIDIEDNLFQNTSNKKPTWLNNQNVLFKSYLKRGIKNPQQECVYKQKNMKTWVGYSLGQGSGFGAGSDYDPDRNAFVFLVMMMVLVMLLLTTAWVLIVFQSEELYEIFRKPSFFSIMGATIGMTIIYYGMMCVAPLRKPPCVFIMLLLTVFFMSWMSAIVTCRYDTVIVFYALLVTSAIVFACVILACTAFDFTSFWLYFVVFSVGFSVVAMCILLGMMMTKTYLKPVHLGLLIITVCLQSMGLVMELQMILGGKSIELEEDEYGLAAFMLYTSIVKMFLNIVQILGLLDSD